MRDGWAVGGGVLVLFRWVGRRWIIVTVQHRREGVYRTMK